MALLDREAVRENQGWLFSPLNDDISTLGNAIQKVKQIDRDDESTAGRKLDQICLDARSAYCSYLGMISAFTDTNDEEVRKFAKRAAENLMSVLATAHDRLAEIQRDRGRDPECLLHWKSVGAKIDALRDHGRTNFGFEL